MICTCPIPGLCPVLKRNMIGRPYEICSGTSGLSEEKRAAYIAQWARGGPVDAAAIRASSSQPCKPPRGPGTELKKLIAQLGLSAAKGCGCDAKAAQMDAWGAEGTRQHKAEIVAWLHQQQRDRGWGDVGTAAAHAFASGLVFRINPIFPFESMVDLAIERAESVKVD